MTTDTKRSTEIQRLSAGDLNPLANLIDHLALAQHFPGDAVLNGADPLIRYASVDPEVILNEYSENFKPEHWTLIAKLLKR